MGFRKLLFFAVISGVCLLQSCSTGSHAISTQDRTRNQSRSRTTVKHNPPNKTYPAPSTGRRAQSGNNADISDVKKKRNLKSGDDLESRTRNEIVSYARKFLGVRYQYGGRNPRGFDCSGLTCHVMSAFNLELPPTSSLQAVSGRKISWKNTLPGDLIFFGKGGRVNHVAIVTQNHNGKVFVIHSTVSKGVKIDEITNNSYWRPRIMGAANYLSVNKSWSSR